MIWWKDMPDYVARKSLWEWTPSDNKTNDDWGWGGGQWPRARDAGQSICKHPMQTSKQQK